MFFLSRRALLTGSLWRFGAGAATGGFRVNLRRWWCAKAWCWWRVACHFGLRDEIRAQGFSVCRLQAIAEATHASRGERTLQHHAIERLRVHDHLRAPQIRKGGTRRAALTMAQGAVVREDLAAASDDFRGGSLRHLDEVRLLVFRHIGKKSGAAQFEDEHPSAIRSVVAAPCTASNRGRDV